MGLVEFVKQAGETLFGADPAAAEATSDEVVLSKRATSLEERVRALALPVDDLKIKLAGTTAVVKGRAASQADREKVVLAIGNTAGIAAVDDRLEVAGGEAAARYYTVASGDTLSKIAKSSYGDASKYAIVFEANKPMLKDPDRIYPGQVLRIPPLPT